MSSKIQYFKNYYNKLIIVIAMVCLSIVSSIFFTIPSTKGYEYSIYDYIPFFFWFLIGIIFFSPFVYLIISTSVHQYVLFNKKTAYALLSISIITLVFLYYIPLMRGYLSPGGDTHQHMGYVVDICNYGFIPIDHYPYSHVLISVLLLVFNIHGIQGSNITFHVVPLLSILFITSFYCLSRSIRCNEFQVITITAIATIPIMGNFISGGTILPSTIGWLLIPLFLYCLYNIGISKMNNKKYLILAIILSASFWFVHPETVLFVSFWIFIIIVLIIFNNLSKKTNYQYSYLIMLLCFLLIGFLFFFSYTTTFQTEVKSYGGYLFGETTTKYSPINEIHNDTTYYRKIMVLMETYGQIVIISILSLLCLFYYLFDKKLHSNNYNIVLILFCFTAILSFIFLLLGSAIGIHIYRQYKYILIFSILLLGFFFSDVLLLHKKNNIQKVFSSFFIISVILIVFFSLGNCFQNTSLGQVSQQVTNQDIVGMQLFYQYCEPNFHIIETFKRPHQLEYYWLFYGISNAKNIPGSSNNINEILPPVGLGYPEFKKLGEHYLSYTYFLKYPPVDPYHYWFIDTMEYFRSITPQYYNQINIDPSVSKIQDVNELSVYLISPIHNIT